METEFKESSGMPIWVSLVILCPVLVTFVILVTQKNIQGLYILIIVEALLFVGIYALRLSVNINQKGISYAYFPFISQKNIQWENVKDAKIVHYDPLSDASGWGFKSSKKYGKVYSTQGDIGLSIITKDGKKYLLGILDEKNAKKILEKYVF